MSVEWKYTQHEKRSRIISSFQKFCCHESKDEWKMLSKILHEDTSTILT